MIKGCVRNMTDRSKHIFKMSVPSGRSVTFKKLYETYRRKYKGKLDLDFIKWLQENKIPKEGWEVVIDKYEDEFDPTKKLTEISEPQENKVTKVTSLPAKRIPIQKLTAADIADLKHKDSPKKTVQQIMSVHKLRRALTLCKGKPGKNLLTRYIKERIDEIKH
ncbi:MAG TPA: hypothetical protein ENI23_09690 [bacterium]|nr:hypothetical protein [bacterium]